jgi:hypothetical protein
MRHNLVRSGSLFLLAVIFTGGLTFTTIVLPDVVDGVLQRTITTPGGDSHADAIARLKTELFIAHYHIRAVSSCSASPPDGPNWPPSEPSASCSPSSHSSRA